MSPAATHKILVSRSRLGALRCVACVLLAGISLQKSTVYGADCVTPGMDVVGGVALKARPARASTSIGMLKRGEHLPFVAYVPGASNWYETRLMDGRPAFARAKSHQRPSIRRGA